MWVEVGCSRDPISAAMLKKYIVSLGGKYQPGRPSKTSTPSEYQQIMLVIQQNCLSFNLFQADDGLFMLHKIVLTDVRIFCRQRLVKNSLTFVKFSILFCLKRVRFSDDNVGGVGWVSNKHNTITEQRSTSQRTLYPGRQLTNCCRDAAPRAGQGIKL